MKFSFIVSTRNRAKAIQDCLDAMAASIKSARLGDGEAEIVVVDNGSTDGTSDAVRSWADQTDVPVRLCFEPVQGLARARNLALRKASGAILAITDDDCRVETDYVRQALDYDAVDQELVLRCGRTILGDPDDLPLTVTTSETSQRWHLDDNSIVRASIGDCGFGCNMVMSRSVQERVGFFDVNLGAGTKIGAGEDTDYFMRAYLARVAIESVTDLVVLHYHGRRSVESGRDLIRTYMRGSGALYAKHGYRHPNFLRPLYWDMRHAFQEVATGRKLAWPTLGVSHFDKVRYNLLGALQYASICRGRRETRLTSAVRHG